MWRDNRSLISTVKDLCDVFLKWSKGTPSKGVPEIKNLTNKQTKDGPSFTDLFSKNLNLPEFQMNRFKGRR